VKRKIALAFASGVLAIGNSAAAAEGEACELHLWGAVKVFPAGSNWVAVGAPVGSYNADRSNPIANVNALDPLVRLKGVPDSAFDGYFGKGVPIKVVRHDDVLDLKAVNQARGPLSPRSAPCNGDVVISNLVDVEWPSRNPNPGLVALVMAPAGMNMKVSFTRYDQNGKLISRQRDGVNGKLQLKRADWASDPSKTVIALDAAVAGGIEAFGKKHLGLHTD
jgi:hypothetical protein